MSGGVSAWQELYQNRDIDGLKKFLIGCKKDEKIAIIPKILHRDGSSGPIYEIHASTATTLLEETPFQIDEKFKEQLIFMLLSLSENDPVIKELLVPMFQRDHYPDTTGSGPGGKMLDHYFCANSNPKIPIFCVKPGTLQCANCHLVSYCSKECQKTHWKLHKIYCKSTEYLDRLWQPRWITEGREPVFLSQTAGSARLGMEFALWGNTAAVDVIRFQNNEMKDGSVHTKKMSLAFIASGDFRSVVETLASVPQDYAGPIEIVINDFMPFVVARNLLMTSLLLLHGDKAIDSVINVWYSVALPLKQLVGPIGDVLIKLSAFNHGENANGKLEFGFSSIELIDLVMTLRNLLQMTQNRTDMQEAMKQRNSVILNPSRRDYVDRHLLGQKAFHKESYDQFRVYGLMLPYECFNAHHNTPNMFLFLDQRGWMIKDSADPKDGWDMIKVMKFGDQMKLPKNDLYGRLFFYIRDRLTKMVATIRRVPTSIRFFQKDVKNLAKALQEKRQSFDRIDVSNICDENYIGIERVLNDWGPLLNKSNPNSANITLFLNWFCLDEMVVPGKTKNTTNPHPQFVIQKSETPHPKSLSFLGIGTGLPSTVPSPTMLSKGAFLLKAASQLLTDNSGEFNKYIEMYLKSKPSSVERRIQHKIVPHRIMFPLDAAPEATAEFLSEEEQYVLLNWSINHMDRYAEWVLG